MVSGADDFSLGKPNHLEGARRSRSFAFFERDFSNVEQANECLKSVSAWKGTPDLLWHLAANSDISAGVEDAAVDFRKTLQTTFAVIEAARSTGVKKIAFASTSAVYGERDQVLTEDSGPLLPISNYGATKLASEALLSAAAETILESVWIFRFPNVVGPRATHGAIYDFIVTARAKADQLDGARRWLADQTLSARSRIDRCNEIHRRTYRCAAECVQYRRGGARHQRRVHRGASDCARPTGHADRLYGRQSRLGGRRAALLLFNRTAGAARLEAAPDLRSSCSSGDRRNCDRCSTVTSYDGDPRSPGARPDALFHACRHQSSGYPRGRKRNAAGGNNRPDSKSSRRRSAASQFCSIIWNWLGLRVSKT